MCDCAGSGALALFPIGINVFSLDISSPLATSQGQDVSCKSRAMLLHLAAGFAALATISASPSNTTVDDNDPSIVYWPANDWSFGPECSTCTVHLDAGQAYQGTWHDTLYASEDQAESAFQTVSYNFTGTLSSSRCVV